MASKTIKCTLVTPEDKLLDEQVTYASIPAWDGLFGVLPGRAPIVARLGTGELRLAFPETTAAGGERSYFINGGFVKMASDTLTILAEHAVPAENLVESEVKAEVTEADALVPASDAVDATAEVERIRIAREAARAKLAIARKYRGSGI